jgi:hypothetical protein
MFWLCANYKSLDAKNVSKMVIIKVQQMRCTIFFHNMVPPTSIEKKKMGEYFFCGYKSCGIGSMEWHVEFEHAHILAPYFMNLHVVSENMPSSQGQNDGNGTRTQLLHI